jgi:hypothetical protein
MTMCAASDLAWYANPVDRNPRLLFAYAPVGFAEFDAGGYLKTINPVLRLALDESGKISS